MRADLSGILKRRFKKFDILAEDPVTPPLNDVSTSSVSFAILRDFRGFPLGSSYSGLAKCPQCQYRNDANTNPEEYAVLSPKQRI